LCYCENLKGYFPAQQEIDMRKIEVRAAKRCQQKANAPIKL